LRYTPVCQKKIQENGNQNKDFPERVRVFAHRHHLTVTAWPAYARAVPPEQQSLDSSVTLVSSVTLDSPETLVSSATGWAPVPFVSEVTLLTAAEPFGLWDRTRRDAPPFWAFPWAGGQGLARYVLDHPEAVAGRHVLDVASGSGLVAIAAAKAGAAAVTAGDIDEHALAAIALNAAANATGSGTSARITPRRLDLAASFHDAGARGDLGVPQSRAGGPPVVLAADVFYQRDLAATALRFLLEAWEGGADVLVADPGRAFVPAGSLTALLSYDIPVLTVLEDAPVKRVTVYRLP
jgi:predicted nicotinamide N-methyase